MPGFQLELPSKELLSTRTYDALLSAPKFFFAAFTWEGFALIAEKHLHLRNVDAGYYFMSGTGTALGVFVGHLLIVPLLQLNNEAFKKHTQVGLLVSFAAGAAAGTLWQVSVNISHWRDFPFSAAFFFVYVMSSIAYFVASNLVRILNMFLPRDFNLDLELNSNTMYTDLMIALTVGAADAFFVGTDDYQYRHGWLTAFSVHEGSSDGAAIFLAGTSGLCGYLICQTLQNLLLPEGWVWLDKCRSIEGKLSEDGVILNALRDKD